MTTTPRPVAPPAAPAEPPESAPAPARELVLRPRTILLVLGTTLAVGVTVWVLLNAWQVISWMIIAVFFAIALAPGVDALERRGLPNGAAVLAVTAMALTAFGLLAWAFIPPLIEQTTDLIQAIPGALDDLTRGRGPLGFLERDYGIVDRARDALENQAGDGVLGLTSPALDVVRGILTGLLATVTIFFLTIFLLREGRGWVSAVLGLVPARSRPRWERVLAGVTRTIRGYVTGNLLISLIAGLVALAVLTATGVPYAVPLAMVVALLDLIPLVGASLAMAVVAGVAFTQGWVVFAIVLGVLIVYQQVENHLLQPLVYGRTVQLSPLLVLVAVLVGGAIAGVIGALIAIPVAGSLQVVLVEVLAARRDGAIARPGPGPGLD